MRRNFSFIQSNVRQEFMKVYSLDGLIHGINVSTQKYRIRNPDTKQFLELPDPHKGIHQIMFAYVPSTLNYKIVLIYVDKNNMECYEILSVENNKLSWRLLKMPTKDYLERNRKKFCMMLFSDVVHCLCVIANMNDMVGEVISLDLETEQFAVVNLPKVGAELCVSVLENYKKQKWSKKESLFPLKLTKKLEVDGRIVPYLVDRFEKLWFWVKEAREPISCDIKTKRIRSKCAHRHSLVRLEGMQ
ncbi:hypothetical protein POM88_031382 [Heracleum sosnowskyi]|uniref:F-box associated beta-propeller type 3 domain-containing protein n=1 Tax=Heracleum sosnowskyi TaxID=360622 RepID=A0AAD8HXB0_9APIA|nr:hypothetical protein POM88_031382 [Heracleum sosnowskyi]